MQKVILKSLYFNLVYVVLFSAKTRIYKQNTRTYTQSGAENSLFQPGSSFFTGKSRQAYCSYCSRVKLISKPIHFIIYGGTHFYPASKTLTRHFINMREGSD